MADSLNSFSKRLKQLQSEGQDYSALGQILSKSSPASAQLISTAAQDSIQSQAKSIIEKMQAEIARQQAEAQKRAQEAAQAQAAAAARAQADAAAKAAQQQAPKPEEVKVQQPDINKSAYGVDTEKYLDRYSNISRDFNASYSSPSQLQEADKETNRRLMINQAIGETAKTGQDVSGLQDDFSKRAKIWEDQYKYASNPILPPDTETMLDIKKPAPGQQYGGGTGERVYVDRKTIPSGTQISTGTWNDPSKTVAPKPDVTAPTGLNTPDPKQIIGGPGQRATIAPPPAKVAPTIPANPSVVTHPQAVSGTIQAPVPPDPYATTPRVTPPMNQDSSEPRGETRTGPLGAGIQGIATNDLVDRGEPVFHQTLPVTPETSRPVAANLDNSRPNTVTMMNQDDSAFIDKMQDTPFSNRRQGVQDYPVMRFQNAAASPGDDLQQPINPKFRSMNPTDNTSPPITTDDLINRGMARPEDRDFWDARLALDQSRTGKARFDKDIGGDDWFDTPSGAKYNVKTNAYVVPQGNMGEENSIALPQETDSLINKYRNASGSVLETAGKVYKQQSGQEGDLSQDESKIMASAVKTLSEGSNDAIWARPILETAARMSWADKTKSTPEKADPSYVNDWINGYLSGDEVDLAGELDSDLLRLGVSPPGSKMIEKTGMDLSDLPQKWAGVTYRFGGSAGRSKVSVDKTDCSGFVSEVYQEHGLNLPAHTDGAYNYIKQQGGTNVSLDQAKPGDVVFYMGAGTGGAISHHMGIYNGNGTVLDMSGPEGKGGVAVRPIEHAGRYEILHDPRMDRGTGSLTAVLPAGRPPRATEQKGNAASPMAVGNEAPQGLTSLPAQIAGTNPRGGLVAGSGDDPRDMVARVYQRALQETGDDYFSHGLAALTLGEGGLTGAHGDYGKSTGPFQFYWGGGEGNQFQQWLSQQFGRPVSQGEAQQMAKDVDIALDYYIPKAYQFYQRGAQQEKTFAPLAIALGGHNAGVGTEMRRGDQSHAEIYRDAWRRYQSGELSPSDKIRTIAGVSGG